jgi:hypothetical protein
MLWSLFNCALTSNAFYFVELQNFNSMYSNHYRILNTSIYFFRSDSFPLLEDGENMLLMLQKINPNKNRASGSFQSLAEATNELIILPSA